MVHKEKKCAGTGVAKGYGCGLMQMFRRIGLGMNCGCYIKFLTETKEGKEIIDKSIIKSKSNIKTSKAKEKKKALDSLKTRSEWEKDLQKEINSIVRRIDKGVCCISSLRPINSKYDAGHFYSVGSNPAIRFNLFNIYAQSVEQNQHKGGNPLGFRDGIKIVYGQRHLDFVDSLRAKYPVTKLNIDELKEAIGKARLFLKQISINDNLFNNEHRLFLREQGNKYIGIYGESA